MHVVGGDNHQKLLCVYMSPLCTINSGGQHTYKTWPHPSIMLNLVAALVLLVCNFLSHCRGARSSCRNIFVLLQFYSGCSYDSIGDWSKTETMNKMYIKFYLSSYRGYVCIYDYIVYFEQCT